MKIVIRSFAVDSMAGEAEIRAPIQEFLGVVPMVVTSPGGMSAFIVITTCAEEDEAPKSSLLLPNGTLAPKTADEAGPRWRVLVRYEGQEVPVCKPEYRHAERVDRYLGAVMTPCGPATLFVRPA